MDDFDFLRPREVKGRIEWPQEYEIKQGFHWRCSGHVWFYSEGGSSTYIFFEPWVLIRETRKGGWFVPRGYDYPEPRSDWQTRMMDSMKKFVLRDARKKWVYPTPELAFKSFRIRLQHRRLYWEREGERITALEKLVNDQVTAD